MKPILKEIDRLVSRMGTHPVWGYAHCVRVCVLAEDLAREEGLRYDAEALRLASLLHDIGLYRAYSMREGTDHVRRSLAVAAGMLRDGDYPPDASRVVLDAIEHHPPGAAPGHHPESHLLKDAVALDYLGATGLARVFAMVGLEDDVPDLPAAFRHARSLRRSVPDLLRLDASREIARERVVEMDDFFGNLERDTGNLKLL
ncbi:HD domain-containing protein [Rubrobacter marinus]|uniref:HD domain-containing protein n=1 Tax=Rubrobacter marinus TaxID=2653852 RepID=A0A6G8PUT0_9ACTN|nr:HD domain-containing protein [Rubrobacter marinus]QIN77635.1 HD domain-containing protein [Rubrobacter marinus]